ncbi:hypothetical protein [Streptomyces mirabilis]|uniref:hypothetical protein n=1 Tax=Streptomyces mirabilis TaxID=68239 RepID=UPI0036DCFFF0
MGKCCGLSPCNCRVTAGSGVTVNGNGSPANPYVISADSATPTGVQAADTPTVDTTVSGTGTAADPYVVSSAVILDPVPPGGGSNLAHAGPDGIYVECADVRQCISSGDGAAYDPATGVVSARTSTDAGNTVVFGSDGGLFSAGGGGGAPTVVQAGDTTTADNTVTGTGAAGDPYVVTTDVIVDPAPPAGGINLLNAGPDGLYVECADVRQCFSAGDGAAYDPATGEISARVSGDAGNQTTFGADGGIYTPAAATALVAADTPTVDVTVTGTGTAADPYQVAAAVILDSTPPGGGSNLLEEGPGGLYVECADVRQCFSAGDGAAYDPATGEFSARLSTDAGNTVAFGADGGLYSTGGTPTALQAADTPTLNATVTGTGAAGDPYIVSGDVVVAPEPNGVEAAANGLLVAPSADTGNRLAFGADGRLFVPPVPPPEVGCGLQGDGTAASPLAAFPIAGSQPWTDDWNCDPVANSTLKCDPSSGALWTPPEHTNAAVTVQQNHPLGTPTIAVTGGFVLVDSTAWSEGTYTADSLSACRGISFSTRFTGHVELTWSANAQFDLGYAVQINGGALAVRQTHSVLANGPARHERYSFGISQATVLPPHTGYAVRVYPAIRVTAGTVTINQWITDTDLIAMTR